MRDKGVTICVGMWIAFLFGTQFEKGHPNSWLLLIFGIFSIAFSMWVYGKYEK